MFNKDKVKGYNRLNKTKKGFKVSRVKDFLRKERKKDNTKRSIVLGIGATAVLGIGTGILLKRKGISKVSGILNSAKSTTPKYPKGTTIKVKSNPVSSTNLSQSTPSKSSIIQKYNQLPDPWSTPIASRPGVRSTKLLTKKNVNQNRIRVKDIKNNTKEETISSTTKQRGNLTRKATKNKVVTSVVNMRDTQRNYDSLPTEMKAIVQIEKALARPKKSGGLGRPPERTSLKTILDTSNKAPIEKVIGKAKRKVRDRLVREKLINDENVKKK